ncbi:MAG: glycine/sarcosine/betaine reductase selenoprotein B family protein [Pyrinomonadaceae bacterium]
MRNDLFSAGGYHLVMASLDDLKFTHRVFTKNYPFSRYSLENVPAAKLRKPLSECKLAIVTTAGLMRPDDERFDKNIKLGDTSFREIPNGFRLQDLIDDHRSDSFDHAGIDADRNLAFPLDRLKELEAQKTIGSLNDRHFSFMGSILAPRKLINESAPEVAGLLKDDGVDAVLLVPV